MHSLDHLVKLVNRLHIFYILRIYNYEHCMTCLYFSQYSIDIYILFVIIRARALSPPNETGPVYMAPMNST